MLSNICKIATNKDHWCSPFTYQIPNKKNEIYTYKLTTKEKVIAIALAILTAPLIVGAFITFYLVTAYFKNRAFKQSKAEVNERVLPFDGLSLLGKCPTTKIEIRVNKGFGKFDMAEAIYTFKCNCCKTLLKNPSVVLKNCNYSYKGFVKNKIEGNKLIGINDQDIQKSIGNIVEKREGGALIKSKDQKVQKSIPFSLLYQYGWGYLNIKTEPLKV